MTRLALAILTALAVAASCAILTPGARAQDARQQWIHENAPHCCNHEDCWPANARFAGRGYAVETISPFPLRARNTVPAREVIPWPFAETYACWTRMRVRCLFMRIPEAS